MPIVSSSGNQFNPSALVSKTVMGLLQAKPTLAKFANSTHNRIFSDKVKAYAPGTSYTMNIPTYPQVQYGSSVSPSAKQIRTEVITIDTSNDSAISGYINAVRIIDQVSQQLYIQDPDEWNRQYVKPTFDAMYGNINKFLYRQLRNSVAYTVVPRFTNDRGGTNEGGGRWLVGDGVTMLNRALDYMSAMNMNNYEDFVFCMSSATYYDILTAVTGAWSGVPGSINTSPAVVNAVTNRYINRTNEEVVEKGGLSKLNGLYIYHTPYIPYHYSGTNSYTVTAGALPTAGTNMDYTGATFAAATLPSMFTCTGYNTTTGSTPPTPPTVTGFTVSTITPIPETKGYLKVSLTTVAAQTNTLVLQFNPGDIIELDFWSSTTGIPIIAVDPITKEARPERFTCSVACKSSFTVTLVAIAATTTVYFYIPVNFLPYGPDNFLTVPVGTLQTPNELQAVGFKTDVTTSLYIAGTGNDIVFKTVPAVGGVSFVSLRHLGNHSKILGFSRNGLHFVNPPLADIIGAENNQVYDEKARMSLLTTMQGGVAAGTNIMRTSSLWGSGGITDAMVQIPYYPGY